MTILCILVVTLHQKMGIDGKNCIKMGDANKTEPSGGKIVKITTRNQFECMVGLMDENPQLAKGFYKSPDKNYLRNFWKQTAIKLNSLGPPVRDGEGWQKVWNDYKLKTKKKLLFNRQLKAKGAPPYRQHMFSKIEETVIKLMCLDKVAVTQGTTLDTTPNQASPMDVSISVENKTVSGTTNKLANGDCEASTSYVCESQNRGLSSEEDIKPSTSLLENREREIQNQTAKRPLLEGKSETHQDMYVNIIKSLKNIEDNSRDTARIWREILKLKKEKLEIYKRNLQEKEEYRREKQKLRLKKLQLKKLKVDQRLRSLDDENDTDV